MQKKWTLKEKKVERYALSNQTTFERDKKEFSRLSRFFFEKWRRIWPVSFSIILHEMLLNYFWRYFFKGSLVEIFAENVAKGNSVQNDPNFPAKSLSIYTKIFPWHLIIDSIENYLREYETFVNYWMYIETIKVDVRTDHFIDLFMIKQKDN